MISTHCPLHYNGYLQAPPPQQQQQPSPPGAGNLNQAQPPVPPHMYAQNPQMRLQQMPGGVGGVGGGDVQQNQRINQQQQQQQHHHNSHHNHHSQQPQQQQPQNPEQIRMNHQMYPPAGSKGMMPGPGGPKVLGGMMKGMNEYPQKGTQQQFRKHNNGHGAPMPMATATNPRVEMSRPKAVSSVGLPVVDHSHIPTVSANGIPGAAETTVTNFRPAQITPNEPKWTLLSNSSKDDGVAGKEKTAMCLVNELSRYNKLTQQYRLTDEQGPAHQKRFTVTLTLGKEEYTAEGGSIKKAQHAAASEAIQKTKYRHPPVKAHPVRSESSVNLTPTVELNALAMKRREKAVYIFDPPLSGTAGGVGGQGNAMSSHHGHLPGSYAGGNQSQGHYGGGGVNGAPNFAFRGMNGSGPHNMMNNRRFPGGAGPPNMKMGDMSHMGMIRGGGGGRPMVKTGGMGPAGGGRYQTANGVVLNTAMGPSPEQVHVTLEVGGLQFTGKGYTAQAARHNAASKALEVLRKIAVDGQKEGGAGGASGGGAGCGDSSKGVDGKPDSKSPVSMIHEIALKRSMTVTFSVKNETGPSHMKVFSTVCTVGEISVEGQGNSKKASKKNAAEKMYQELLKLPPIQGAAVEGSGGARGAGEGGAYSKGNPRPKKKPLETVKKKPKQIIKPEVEAGTGEELNAISRLMQIQQAKKGKEPVYLLVDQRGTARRREFEMSVEVDGITMTGTGPNKKHAKRIAAEKLLAALGFEVKVSTTSSNCGDNKEGDTSGGSPAKGSKAALAEKGKKSGGDSVEAESPPVVSANGPSVEVGSAKKAKGAKKEKVEKTVTQKLESAEDKEESGSDGARPKDQLIYLSKIIGFKVQFSDFPKGNHSEYLTLITLNTDPPQLCHGAGKTLEASHDQAALTTLHLLSELGLDNVRPKAATPTKYEEDEDEEEIQTFE